MQKLERSSYLYDDGVSLEEKFAALSLTLSSNTTFEKSVNPDAEKGSPTLVKKIDGDLYICEKSQRCS